MQTVEYGYCLCRYNIIVSLCSRPIWRLYVRTELYCNITTNSTGFRATIHDWASSVIVHFILASDNDVTFMFLPRILSVSPSYRIYNFWIAKVIRQGERVFILQSFIGSNGPSFYLCLVLSLFDIAPCVVISSATMLLSCLGYHAHAHRVPVHLFCRVVCHWIKEFVFKNKDIVTIGITLAPFTCKTGHNHVN